MKLTVTRQWKLIDGVFQRDDPPPRKSEIRPGDVLGIMTSLPECAGRDGPKWSLDVPLPGEKGVGTRTVRFHLPPFLTNEEYRRSNIEPLDFSRISITQKLTAELTWLWIYRDGLYVTRRKPYPSEIEEVMLLIKSNHFERDLAFKRLKEQVANYDAIEANVENYASRAIPDDVKLRVWSRDRGVCTRCGSAKELHYDHIIPFSRGGSSTAENIQLLCRTCNLAKSDRLF